jgi:DNA invertase Pin-like site-specific DNA recombinase
MNPLDQGRYSICRKGDRSPEMNVVGYLRVSTNGQLDGYGLVAQEKVVRAYAQTHGMRVVRVMREKAVSGATPAEERPALMDALRLLKDGHVNALLIPNLDRLARELHVQEAALALAWSLSGRVFTAEGGEVTEDDPDDPVRRAMRQMRGVFSELEKGLIVKRLRDGRRAKAEAGGYGVGAPPFGFRAESGALALDSREQEAIELMRRLRTEGRSLRAIAQALDEGGYSPKQGISRGSRWHPAQIARILGRQEVAVGTAS